MTVTINLGVCIVICVTIVLLALIGAFVVVTKVGSGNEIAKRIIMAAEDTARKIIDACKED